MPDPILARLLGVIAEIAGPGRTPPDPGLGTQLAEGGFWLDSSAFLEMIIACEVEFNIEFDPGTELTPDALSTVGSLAQIIRGKVAP